MGVFERRWKDPRTGALRAAWSIKTVVSRPDGRKVTIRKVAEKNERRAAEREERQAVAAVLDGTYQRRGDVLTVAEAVEVFLRATTSEVRASTHRWYANQLRRVVVPALGEHYVDEVHGDVLSDFRTALAADREVETVRGTLRALRRLLNFCAERGHLKQAPPVKLPKKTGAQELPRFFTFEEAAALIEAAREDEEWGALVVVGLQTGLRISELLGLRWEDVDLKGKPRLHVTRAVVDSVESAPKSGKARTVPLNDLAVEVLTSRRTKHPRAKLVFGTSSGTWRTRHQATKAMERLCDAAGVERAGIHTTRHTFASHLAIRGVSLIRIRDLLGHASVVQTEVYARLQPGHGDAEAVSLLGGVGLSAAAGTK